MVEVIINIPFKTQSAALKHGRFEACHYTNPPGYKAVYGRHWDMESMDFIYNWICVLIF